MRLRSKTPETVKAKATKQEGGHEKYNSRSRATCFCLAAPVHLFFFAYLHKSEIRIKKARHIINVRRSRKDTEREPMPASYIHVPIYKEHAFLYSYTCSRRCVCASRAVGRTARLAHVRVEVHGHSKSAYIKFFKLIAE